MIARNTTPDRCGAAAAAYVGLVLIGLALLAAIAWVLA